MAPTTERVFILGGTGNIGTRVVNDLLENKVPVTLFARSSKKVATLFKHSGDLVSVVEGDFSDISGIKEGIKGHSRVFLLVTTGDPNFANIKKTIATWAYEAGAKQVVDISSNTVNLGWRTSPIGTVHYEGEKAVLDIPNRSGYFVALRPSRFMSNILRDSPIANNGIYGAAPSDFRQGYISPNDIGAVAAVVLQEDVEKHKDAVYNLNGDIITPQQQAQFTSRLVGQDVKYHQISVTEFHKNLMATGWFPHIYALDLADYAGLENNLAITPSIEILLGRKPETVEQYLALNKHLIV